MEQNDYATYGELRDDEGSVVCVTLELPWAENRHNASCIPAGSYTAKRRYSPKHKCDVFEVEGVPDRSCIELHIGNLPHDSLGCVLLGTTRAIVNGQAGIVQSRVAFDRFMRMMAGIESFPLTVTDPISAVL